LIRAVRGGQPGRPQAVQGGQGLLGLRLHRHRVDIFVAKGFEQTLGIGAVGLVAQHIGPDHMRGHEDGLVAMGLGVAGPVVC
jgi:hypothetical protein